MTDQIQITSQIQTLLFEAQYEPGSQRVSRQISLPQPIDERDIA